MRFSVCISWQVQMIMSWSVITPSISLFEIEFFPAWAKSEPRSWHKIMGQSFQFLRLPWHEPFQAEILILMSVESQFSYYLQLLCIPRLQWAGMWTTKTAIGWLTHQWTDFEMTEYRPYSQIDLSYVSCSDCVGYHEYTYSRCLGTEPPDHPVSAQQMIG